jgi:hypothetical protein
MIVCGSVERGELKAETDLCRLGARKGVAQMEGMAALSLPLRGVQPKADAISRLTRMSVPNLAIDWGLIEALNQVLLESSRGSAFSKDTCDWQDPPHKHDDSAKGHI